jgi:DNA-binding NarL/FixJ family response regulator
MSLKTEPIRLVLIDRHTIVRAGLRMLLNSYPQFEIVGEADPCDDALEMVRQQQPDLILFEIAGDQSKNLDLIPQLLDAAKRARLMLLTCETDMNLHHQAAQLGAMGVVLKDQSPDVLVKAITKVHAGEAWFDRTTIANLLSQMSRGRANDPDAEKIASLSPREREIIALVGAGLKNQQIADKLGLSEITVRHHLTSIFAKLGVADRLELIIYAYKRNLARLPD